MLTKEKVSQKENVLITRITLRVISGYVTLEYLSTPHPLDHRLGYLN